MKILVIPTTDWLRHPTPHRHHYLAEYMAEDNDVHVLSFDLFEGKKTWSTNANLVPAGGMKFENLIFYYGINAPTHYFRLKKFLKNNKVDIIYGAHPVTNMLAIRAAKGQGKHRPSCIFDFNDFFPEGASLYFKNKTVRKVIRALAELLLIRNLKCTDRVITVSSVMKQYVKNHGVEGVELVTNGVDLSLFGPSEPDPELKRRYGLGDNVIGFVGTMEEWFDIEMMLDSLRWVVKQVPGAQLLLVGGGIKTDYAERLKRRASELGISDKVIFTGIVPYEEVSKYINLMAVGVIPPISKKLFMGKIALPNKLFQYSACNKPILTHPMPEIIRVGGKAIQTFEDNEEFIEKCINILKGRRTNQAGLDLAANSDWRSQCNKILKIFKEEKA